MTQIIEFTKHSDHYLIHHFNFECNDQSTIGKYTGNSSLNKFMSLNDWQIILDDLSETIENYVENYTEQPVSSVRHTTDTNFELHIEWIQLDVLFYSKLLESLDFDVVLPFVMKVNVSLRSNIGKFTRASPIKSPAHDSTVQRKKSTRKTPTLVNNELETIKLKECCVRLPVLEFDENGEVIQRELMRKKRKHSLLQSAESHSKKDTPRGSEELMGASFMCSTTSTPFVRNIGDALKQIENDVRNTFVQPLNQKVIKRLTNRLTTTPRTSNDRKTGSQFNPRIRLLKLPEKLNTSKKSKPKSTGKKTLKSKVKSTTKRPKVKPQSIANESELFEVQSAPKTRAKKPSGKTTDKQPSPRIEDVVKVEKIDLNSLTVEELWKSFDDHCDFLSEKFLGYLKQTDSTVQKAGDYNHFDMISLFTTEQFSVLLDILFDKFVKVSEFGEICYDTLFFELLIPEWTLAICTQRYSIDRQSAIKQINAQKTNQNQSYEGYTTLITTKLDETMNSNLL